MDYQNLVTKNEAIVLAAAFLCEFGDPELTDPLHATKFETEAANTLLYAMRVLHSKDQPVDVISVYEYLNTSGALERYGAVAHALTLPVIVSISQEVRPRAEAIELAGQFADETGYYQ